MVTLYQGQLYACGYGATPIVNLDDVDAHIQFLKNCDDYNEVREYLTEHFGNINGEHWIGFDKYDKECYLKLEENRIEFCSLKNHKQYYGKGWLKID